MWRTLRWGECKQSPDAAQANERWRRRDPHLPSRTGLTSEAAQCYHDCCHNEMKTLTDGNQNMPLLGTVLVILSAATR